MKLVKIPLPLAVVEMCFLFYSTMVATLPCMYALQLDQQVSWIRKSTIHLLAQGFLLLACLDGLFAHQSHLVQDDREVLLNPLVLGIERKYVKKPDRALKCVI